MSSERHLFLDVNYELRPDAGKRAKPWWEDGSILGKLLHDVKDLDLWLAFSHTGRRGAKKLGPIRSLADLIAATTTWEDLDYVLHSRPQGGLEASSLALGLRRGLFRLQLAVAPEDLPPRRDTICDRMIQLVARAHAAFAGRAWLAEQSSIRPLGPDTPHARPPRDHPVLTLGAVVNFLDPDYIAHRDEKFPEEHLAVDFAKLKRARMPEAAAYETHGDLIVLRWISDPVDDDSIARACARNEAWLGRTLDPPPQSGWNAAGDQEVDIPGLEPHPPFTLYDPDAEHGYKTVAATRAGKLAPSTALDEIARWLRAGRLPDRTPVSGVTIIVPTRAAALKLHDRADAIGARIVYTDDDARLWDPFPEGEWIE
jgi:hypothetical protein